MSRSLHSPRHDALCAILADRRRSAGLTQTQVADALRRPQSYVATVEQGQRTVDVVTLLDFAEVIGFDPYEVLREVAAQPKA